VWRALVRPPRRAAARGGWADEIAALPAARRRPAIAEVVRQEIARVMALASGTQVAEDRPLQELGLDSLMAVELRNALGKRAGATLPATLAFDYPTPAAITGYLFDNVLSLGGAAVTASAASGNPTAPGLTIEAMSGLSDEQAMARLQLELSGALELP
jgi:acyl carrier protein